MFNSFDCLLIPAIFFFIKNGWGPPKYSYGVAVEHCSYCGSSFLCGLLDPGQISTSKSVMREKDATSQNREDSQSTNQGQKQPWDIGAALSGLVSSKQLKSLNLGQKWKRSSQAAKRGKVLHIQSRIHSNLWRLLLPLPVSFHKTAQISTSRLVKDET